MHNFAQFAQFTLSPEPRLLLIALTLAAAACDWKWRRIPNWLTAPSIIVGIGVHSALDGQQGFQLALGGILVAALVYIPLFALRAMGAGDVKLMAALGAIAGPTHWIAIFLATSIIGGAAALAITFYRRRVNETWFNVGILLTNLSQFRAPYQSSGALDVRNAASLRMPHGVSIAAGTIAALVASPFVSL